MIVATVNVLNVCDNEVEIEIIFADGRTHSYVVMPGDSINFVEPDKSTYVIDQDLRNERWH